MSAYIIVEAQITDFESFKPYAQKAAELVAANGGRYVVRGGDTHSLEGGWDPDTKVVVSEWPDMETARAFWDSPQYREASKMRKGTGKFRVYLVDGID